VPPLLIKPDPLHENANTFSAANAGLRFRYSAVAFHLALGGPFIGLHSTGLSANSPISVRRIFRFYFHFIGLEKYIMGKAFLSTTYKNFLRLQDKGF
jgi:hypothetical protein